MSQAGKFWNTVKQQSKSMNQSPVQVGTVKSLSPLSIQFQGIELSPVNGDTIYINNLLLDEAISFTEAQPITCSNGSITENHTDIINAELEAWLVAVHNRFILHIGDYVAVQKLGNNSYLILEKVQKVEQ